LGNLKPSIRPQETRQERGRGGREKRGKRPDISFEIASSVEKEERMEKTRSARPTKCSLTCIKKKGKGEKEEIAGTKDSGQFPLPSEKKKGTRERGKRKSKSSTSISRAEQSDRRGREKGGVR